MKINLKKVASVLASAVMLGSTLGFAAAAWADPFVKNGVGDAAIVVGAGAAATDMVAATDLGTSLNAKITATDTTVAAGGDTKELSKENSKINLGDKLSAVYATLDKDELSKVLADGIYEDADGTEYDYEQSIALGATTLTHFVSDDVNEDEKPVIGFDIASSAEILTYTLDFTDKPINSSAVMDDTFLEMLGVKYYVSAVEAGLKLTLLDSANTATVDSSGPTTVTVGDKTYTVEIVSVSEGTTNKATLKVNGEKIDSTNQGSSRKIDTNTYLSIVDVNEASRESDLHYVEFSIGSGKVVLTDGENLELNDKSIDGVAVNLTSSSGKLDQIKLVWTADEESFLVSGMDLVLPGLESIKLSTTGFTSSDVEEMSIANSGDDYMQLKDVKVKDGTISNLPILYSDAGKTNFTGLGKDATHKLVTAANNVLELDEDTDSYFVASRATADDFESYVFELKSVNKVESGVHNETTIKNLATDKEFVITDSDTMDFGDITLTTSSVSGDAGNVNITVSTGTGTAYTTKIYTAAGMGISLPLMGTTTANTINVTGGTTSWIMNITEGDKDNNVDQSSTTVTLGHTATKGPEVSDLPGISELAVESNSDDYEGYVISNRATKVLYKTGGDQDTLDIMYPVAESYAKVYVSESAVSFSGSNSIKVIKDSEIDSAKDKNLIVVGGSCINSVAATMLGASAPVCGADFTALTEVAAGKYLIEVIPSPYATADKIAMLVAGYDAAETTLAAAKVKEGTVSTDVGTKLILPQATA
jgi:hypothetical protein